MMRWLSALVCIAAVTASGAMAAEPDEEETPVFEAEPMVVVATGEEEEPGKLPVSVSVITREEIERSGSLNLMDMLVREPGVWVSRQGGMGFGGTVSIRGFGGSPPTQVAVTVDGHPSQMGIMGHIIPTSYLVENVERVEILRGPSGALHGSMAIGGVINIVSRSAAEERADGTAEVRTGTFDNEGWQIWLAGGDEKAGYRAQVGRLDTDGDHPFAAYESDNYSLALDYALSESWDAAFRSQRTPYTAFDQREVADAYAEGRDPIFIEQEFDREDYDLALTHHGKSGRTEVKLYRTQGDHEFEDGYHSEDFGEGIHLTHLRTSGGGSILFGLDLDRYGGDIFSPLPLRNTFERDEPAIYAMASQTSEGGSEISGGLRYTKPEDFDGKLLPQIGVFHPLEAGWSIFGSIRRGFRTPSFRELFLFGINNPDLEPESAWQYEVGARRALAGGGQFEVSIFRIDGDNLILSRPRPPEAPPGPLMQLTNVEDVKRVGFEIGTRQPVGARTGVYGSFSYLDAGDVKEQTIGRKFVAGIDHRIGEWMLAADIEYAAKIYDFDQTGTLLEVSPFAVVNLKMSHRVTRGLRAGLVVENLLDRGYRMDPAYPFPMPGRAYRFILTQEW